jgi:hypothetical protein
VVLRWFELIYNVWPRIFGVDVGDTETEMDRDELEGSAFQFNSGNRISNKALRRAQVRKYIRDKALRRAQVRKDRRQKNKVLVVISS